MRKYNGFTLLEILIAIFIMAIIGSIISFSLNTIIRNQNRLKLKNDSLTEFQIACDILERDIRQIINRPIIDESNHQKPYLLMDQHTLEFTRSGYINFNQNERHSTLQRVAYQFEDNQLIRYVWSVLDRTPTTPVTKEVLLHNVNDVKFQFISAQPHQAISVNFDLPTLGSVRRLIPLGITIQGNMNA